MVDRRPALRVQRSFPQALWPLLMLGLAAATCVEPEAITGCSEGDSRLCACDSGASGSQICDDSSGQWGACACADELDGGSDAFAGVDAGAVDTRTSDGATLRDAWSADGTGADAATPDSAGPDAGLSDRAPTEAAVSCAVSCDCPVGYVCGAEGHCQDPATVFPPYLHPICCLDPDCAGAGLPCERPDGSQAFCGALDAGLADRAVADSLRPDATAADIAARDQARPDSGVPGELCPDLPIPDTCYGRHVVYREWSPGVSGDGSYFAGQEPDRLGFTRSNGAIWVVKFQVEVNTYEGVVAAYGDTVPGAAWISSRPCDVADAFALPLVNFSLTGGGTLRFVVAKDDADAETLRNDPDYAPDYGRVAQLRGGGCYYLAFESTGAHPEPLSADYLATTEDWCGRDTGGACGYLAMDFSHWLHHYETGNARRDGIISGLTEIE